VDLHPTINKFVEVLFTMASSSASNSSSNPSEASPSSLPNNVIEEVRINEPVGVGVCEVERVLVEHSNRLTILAALCIGLEEIDDNGSKKPLLDFNEAPFTSLKKKEIKPSLDCLREEVKRRSDLAPSNPTKAPKPNGWNAAKCIEWLKENPILSDDDIAFLHRKVMEVREVVANGTTQKSVNQESDGDRETGNKWIGPLPYLRLIHCLLEDDIKEAFLRRHRSKTIQEIDARRSDVRPDDVHDLIANKWNSSTFNPKTMVSNCHYDYAQEIDIGYEVTRDFSRATPTKVKDKLAKMKSDLTSIISKWERSGQGDGGTIEESDEDDDEEVIGDETSTEQPKQDKFEWGRSKGRTGAFDCRESFLGPNPSYLLYFWDVLDDNDLFDTTINRLSDEAGASSPNQPPSVGRSKGQASVTSEMDNLSTYVSTFRNVIVAATNDATVAADRRHEENKQEKERRHRESQQAENERVAMKSSAAEKRVILQAELDNKGYLKRRIDSLQDEARRIRFKIFDCEEHKRDREALFCSTELMRIEQEIDKCSKELNGVVEH
jgi:hypothetical protein